MHNPNSIYNSILFNQIVFLITGIVTTIGNQYVTYSGAASQGTLIPVAITYYGMALAYFLPKEKSTSPINPLSATPNRESQPLHVHVKIAILSFIDFVANALGNLGIIYAGSGIYQVLHSSVVTFTALLARVFLNKKLSRNQWMAIGAVTLGLMFSAVGGTLSENSSHNDADSGHVLKGFFLTLISTVLFSLIYCMAEWLLNSSKEKDPNENTHTHPQIHHPQSFTSITSSVSNFSSLLSSTERVSLSPLQLQTYEGAYTALLVTAYLYIYTLPRYDSLVREKIEQQNGDYTKIIITYIILLASAFGHSVTYFKLMGTVGAVSTGILQSLRAVTVFFISAFLFCDDHSNQCLNIYKGIATMLVVAGILLFSKAKEAKLPDITKSNSVEET